MDLFVILTPPYNNSIQHPTRWDGWNQPNVNWCEAHLCEIISTPSNTWSNLAYVAAGVYMMKQAGRSKDVQLFGPAAIATGVFSGKYLWNLGKSELAYFKRNEC